MIGPETYYFGCIGQPGHYWFAPGPWQRGQSSEIERRVGRNIHPRIDSGFCPGVLKDEETRKKASWERTRPEVQGEAAIHHIDGWTILSFWDRSVDNRGACNSNFVALGEHDFAGMCEIASSSPSPLIAPTPAQEHRQRPPRPSRASASPCAD